MKSRLFHFFLVTALMLSFTGFSQVNAHGDYAENLAALVRSQDSTYYFNEMKLTIGKNVLYLDGDEIPLDAAPEIFNNRTMLPIRAIAEAVGASVEYDPENKTVTIITTYDDVIICPAGADVMLINNEEFVIDSPSYIKNGRTYLPLRAIAEAMEFTVAWDQDAQTVILTAPYQTARILVFTDVLDVSGLNAREALYDENGMWVMQFATPSEAKSAIALLAGQGIAAEPDYFISLSGA